MVLADLAIKHDQEWGVQWELNGIPSQQYVNISVCVCELGTLRAIRIWDYLFWTTPIQTSGNSHIIILDIKIKQHKYGVYHISYLTKKEFCEYCVRHQEGGTV